MSLSFTQKPSESDSWGQGSEVDEDDGSEDLSIQSVCVVADVVAKPALHVLHHSTKRITCTGQRVLPRLLWTLISYTAKQIKFTLIPSNPLHCALNFFTSVSSLFLCQTSNI